MASSTPRSSLAQNQQVSFAELEGPAAAVTTTGTSAASVGTLNAASGQITTLALTTAAGASSTVTLTNSVAQAGDIVLVDVNGGTNTTQNLTISAVASAGSILFTIFNNTASTAFNGTLILGYLVVHQRPAGAT